MACDTYMHARLYTYIHTYIRKPTPTHIHLFYFLKFIFTLSLSVPHDAVKKKKNYKILVTDFNSAYEMQLLIVPQLKIG